MKKIAAFLLGLLVLCSLAACVGKNVSSSSTPSPSTTDFSSKTVSEPAATSEPTPTPEPTPAAVHTEEPVSEAEPNTGTKVLVAYFSATGNTRPLAEYIADSLGADLYEIVPKELYTDADLDYGNSNSRTSIEMNDPNSRPAINGSVENMEQYDIVFVGYPIWWGKAPKIIHTFLEAYNFSGKTIVPFCTSGGGGYNDSTIKPLAPDATWLTGRRFSGGASFSTVESWVNSLDLTLN